MISPEGQNSSCLFATNCKNRIGAGRTLPGWYQARPSGLFGK
jgi:hypothetical protein